MIKEQAIRRLTERSPGVTCYVFDDVTVSTATENPDDLRAIIGALLIELDQAKPRRRWWRFW